MLDDADRVWNRAALENGGRSPRTGDRALAAIILADGLIGNGGVLHCLEVLDPREIASAVEGFRYFGLDPVADFFHYASETTISEVTGDLENEFNERYWALADGRVLEDAFKRRFAETHEDFSPLS